MCICIFICMFQVCAICIRICLYYLVHLWGCKYGDAETGGRCVVCNVIVYIFVCIKLYVYVYVYVCSIKCIFDLEDESMDRREMYDK